MYCDKDGNGAEGGVPWNLRRGVKAPLTAAGTLGLSAESGEGAGRGRGDLGRGDQASSASVVRRRLESHRGSSGP